MMALPEPVTIASVLMATIGFFNTVRDGIQKIHDDSKSWKKIRNRCDTYGKQSKALHEKLIHWENQYMVWENDGDLFADLWGREWSAITDLLDEVHELLEKVSVDITSLTRPTKGAAKGLRHTGKKCSYILWKQKPLEANLESLKGLIFQLEDLSRTKFKSQHPNRAGRDVTDAEIHEVGNAYQLVRLANATQSISDALYQPCLDAQQELHMNMELNFFGEDVANAESTDFAATRSKAISVSAKAREIHFTFLASKNPNPLTRTRLKNDPSIKPNDCYGSIIYAFNQMFERNVGTTAAIGFRTFITGPLFSVREVRKDETEALHPDSYQRFRTLLLDKQQYSAPFQRRHMDLTKIKAAFELIECGLLFLRTQWLSRFCSCGLRRRGATTKDHEYLLGAKFNQIKDQERYCWCTYRPHLDRPLRYLGLLLVEIALGRPVIDLRPRNNSDEDFPAPFELGFRSATAPLANDLLVNTPAPAQLPAQAPTLTPMATLSTDPPRAPTQTPAPATPLSTDPPRAPAQTPAAAAQTPAAPAQTPAAPEQTSAAPALPLAPAQAPATDYFTLAATLEEIGQASGAADSAYVDAVEYCLKSELTPKQVNDEALRGYYWDVLAP